MSCKECDNLIYALEQIVNWTHGLRISSSNEEVISNINKATQTAKDAICQTCRLDGNCSYQGMNMVKHPCPERQGNNNGR
jgi:hypothetical protein